MKIINVSDLVVSESLFSEYDDDLNSAIIDEKKLRRRLKDLVDALTSFTETIVIECHAVGCIPRKLVDQVIVLQANTDVLYDRLCERNYPKRKIDENMDCEIMQVVLEEAVDRFENVPVKTFTNNTAEDANTILEYIMNL